MSEKIRAALHREQLRLLAAVLLTAAGILSALLAGRTGSRNALAAVQKTEEAAMEASDMPDYILTEGGSRILKNSEGGSWTESEAGWSYNDAEGRPVSASWLLYQNRYYYLNAAGIMECGQFRKIGTYRYHFAADGSMDSGRFYVGEQEYYADVNGIPCVDSWASSEDGRWFYCDSIGRILKDEMTPDSYYVGPDGYMAAAAGSRYEGFDYSNEGNHRLYLNLGTADLIWNYFKGKGWEETAIAGLLGNFQQESGIDPGFEERGNHIGYGLGQWSFERRTQLEHYAASRGCAAGDIYAQLDFLCQEAGEKDFVNHFAKTKWSSPAAAAIEWGTRWERYNLSDRSMSRVRIPYAEAYYAHYVAGVSFLVSNTRYSEPEVLVKLASAADAEVREELSPEDAAVTAQELPEEIAEKSNGTYFSEGDHSELKTYSGQSAGAKVTKVKRVLSVQQGETAGPGIEMKTETEKVETEALPESAEKAETEAESSLK